MPFLKSLVTLRAKLVVLVFAAIIPLLGMALFNAWRNADAAVGHATDNLKFAASLVAANQLRVTDSAHQILTAIANTPGLLEGTPSDCHRYLKTLREQLPVYGNLGIIGLDGYFRCQSLVNAPLPYAGDREFFQQAVASRGFVAGGYFMGRVLGKPVVPFAMPLMDRDGKVTAVAFVTLDLGEMAKAVASTVLPQDSRVAVMDRQGILLAVGPEKSGLIGKLVPSPLIRDAVKTMRTGVGEGLDNKGRQRIFAFLPAGNVADAAFFVSVSADRDEVLAPVQTQLGRVLLVLSLVASLGGLIAWRMASRAIVKPTTDILEATRSLQNGQLEARVPTGLMQDGGELYKIAAGFNRMAESLQANRAALEAELARSRAGQEKLQDAQRLARIAYWQIELATGRFWWSDEVYEVLGSDRTVLDGSYDSFIEVIHPSDREVFRVARDDALQAEAVLDTELRVLTSAGEVRWMHVFGRVHARTASELSTHRSGVVQDITERKLSELAIARSKEMLSRTGALARVGGWELALEPRKLIWSDQTYRIHEMDRSEGVELEAAINHYEPKGRELIRAAMAAAIRDGLPWDLELPLTTGMGKRCWVRTQGQALMEDGKVVRLVGALQDITEQHQAQELLRLLETCISRLNDMVVITDAEPPGEAGPRIVFVNDAFERHTGYTRQDVLGKSPGFLQGPNTRRTELDRIGTAMRDGQPVRAELINYTRSGREFWVELDIVPISDANGGLTHWVAVQRDITQRKLAEQALIDSEQRYAALFDAAPIPMWVFDLETKQFLTVNKTAQKTYGYSTEEFLSMSVFDIRPEEDRSRLQLDIAGADTQRRGAWRHRRKDGSVFPVDIVSQPIQHAGRNARFIVALDISAKVKAENDVQEYLFTLQRAADAAQAITWHQTLEGTMQEIAEQARGVIGAHQAWVSLSGHQSHEPTIHALSLSEKYAQYRGLSEPSDGSGIYALVCETNRSLRLTQAELEAHPRWRGLGSQAPMRGWLAVPLTGRNGENVGVLQLSDKYEGEFTQQDEYVAIELAHLASAAVQNSRLLEEIGQLNASLEQKVAERTAALSQQEALFRALTEQAPEIIWTADLQGAVTYVNRTWIRLVGGTPEDWKGSRWFAVIHPDDLREVIANWQAGQATQTPFVGTRRVLALDGSWHTMSYRGSPVFDEQGAVVFWVGIDADITQIKAIEAALRLSNQELEAFSYSVSHDLRSPLNTVDGFSRLLARLLAGQAEGEAGEKVRHYLSRIQAGVAQMGQLIEDLLSLAQVTRAELRSEAVDLSALTRGIVQEWQTLQPEREVLVSIEAGLQAQGDGRLVKVVLENLLGNAWKFTSHQAHAEISIGQTVDAAGVRIFFVRDNGVGFDMAYADKLFTPFQRLHAVKEFAGTGIGLATVSRVVERHGGRIWADAEPGRGATFSFTLPHVLQVVLAA
jgi:PAS domain S-box-containing protein